MQWELYYRIYCDTVGCDLLGSYWPAFVTGHHLQDSQKYGGFTSKGVTQAGYNCRVLVLEFNGSSNIRVWRCSGGVCRSIGTHLTWRLPLCTASRQWWCGRGEPIFAIKKSGYIISVIVNSHNHGKRIAVQLTSSEFPACQSLSSGGILLEGGRMLLHMILCGFKGADGWSWRSLRYTILGAVLVRVEERDIVFTRWLLVGASLTNWPSW